MGDRIDFRDGRWVVPDRPVIPFIEGDGTGPDIWRASRRVFDAVVEKVSRGKRRVEWLEVLAGEKAFQQTGNWLPEETLENIRRYRVAIKGPLTTPVGGGIRSLNVALRQLLDLYACIRPVRYFAGVPSPMREPEKLDVVVYRENTEDVYTGVEYAAGSPEATRLLVFLRDQFGAKIREGSALGIKPMSRFGSQRLVVKAIEYAIKARRPSVTLVHKGNIMKFTEGAFREWGYEVAKERFGDKTVSEAETTKGKGAAGRVVIKDRIADSMFQQVLLRPEEYSVIATPNLNGDYLSDACVAQIGGLGMAPGGNVGDGFAVFEATHGTAPKYAGLDKVNPGAVLLSGAMMFEELGWSDSADAIIRGLSGAVAAKRARALGATQLAFAVAPEARNNLAAKDLGQVIVEGAGQGAWTFTELKAAPDDPKPDVETVAIVCDPKEATQVAAGQKVGDGIAAGHRLARYLQMQPGNVCTPSYLADRAQQLATAYGFGLTVLDRAALQKEGLAALLAVAQGSVQEPRFIVLEYRATDGAALALIGKGVTFDSGGISIKPAQNMEDMKFDMSGAAAVLGTFETLGRLSPKINVIGLIPSTENLPSGTAVKPGDVIKSHLGKTIEVINTDAEGRLILCDALSYVRRFKPAAVLDAATLTGAVVVALGHVAIGVMGNDEGLLAEVRDAGERAGERCWPLPLWDEYRELLKSDIADVKNSGGRGAGTIAGGWFLREFVNGFPWVHLDIAGTAYTDAESPHQTKGPTAVGVRLFTEFILKRAGA